VLLSNLSDDSGTNEEIMGWDFMVNEYYEVAHNDTQHHSCKRHATHDVLENEERLCCSMCKWCQMNTQSLSSTIKTMIMTIV
jgi:hypothetical protein